MSSLKILEEIAGRAGGVKLREDNILFIDDFLANGEAALGAYRLILDANSHLAGIGIVIEKSFQLGRKKLENLGLDIYSLARIKSFENNCVQFIN